MSPSHRGNAVTDRRIWACFDIRGAKTILFQEMPAAAHCWYKFIITCSSKSFLSSRWCCCCCCCWCWRSSSSSCFSSVSCCIVVWADSNHNIELGTRCNIYTSKRWIHLIIFLKYKSSNTCIYTYIYTCICIRCVLSYLHPHGEWHGVQLINFIKIAKDNCFWIIWQPQRPE